MGAGGDACTKVDCALKGWRAQYASPVVETTVVCPQYGTTTLLAILASAAVAGGESYRIQWYSGLAIAMQVNRSGLECAMCNSSGWIQRRAPKRWVGSLAHGDRQRRCKWYLTTLGLVLPELYFFYGHCPILPIVNFTYLRFIFLLTSNIFKFTFS